MDQMTSIYGKLKRGSAMLLSILMLVSVLPVSALADAPEPTAAPELAAMPEPTATPEPEPGLPPVDAALKLDKPFEGVLKKEQRKDAEYTAENWSLLDLKLELRGKKVIANKENLP